MTVNDIGANLTVGGAQWPASVSNCIDYRPWDYSYPYGGTYVYPNVVYREPVFCSGEIHVFGCEHAATCKCGKASRTPEPVKCGACGK